MGISAFILVLIIEILSFLVLKDYFFKKSKFKFFAFLSIHMIFSVWIWILLFRVSFYKGFFDTQENNNNIMILNGLMVAVILNRVLIILLHYSGKLFKIRRGGFVKSLTRTGLVISAVIFLVCSYGFLIGRYNFKTEEVTIYFKDLDKGLDGIKIVHISDLHLPAFYRHPGQLRRVVRIINSCQPDLLINTGDFVNYGWREFDRYDTILVKAQARYGSFAILGNHDMGTYLPDSSEEEREFNVLKMCELIESSGYHLLNKDHSIVDIGGSKVALIGVPTSGHFPSLIHSDIKEAAKGLDSIGFKILLCHDPNQWEEEVTGKTDIELTLSGHTHGMQVGILAGRLRWSPAKYFYPNWNGLYQVEDQYQYVNRGLGVLGIPFRIWMSPEISVITLKAE